MLHWKKNLDIHISGNVNSVVIVDYKHDFHSLVHMFEQN